MLPYGNAGWKWVKLDMFKAIPFGFCMLSPMKFIKLVLESNIDK